MADLHNRERTLEADVDAAARRVARHVSLTISVVSLATVLGAAAVYLLRWLVGD